MHAEDYYVVFYFRAPDFLLYLHRNISKHFFKMFPHAFMYVATIKMYSIMCYSFNISVALFPVFIILILFSVSRGYTIRSAWRASSSPFSARPNLYLSSSERSASPAPFSALLSLYSSQLVFSCFKSSLC